LLPGHQGAGERFNQKLRAESFIGVAKFEKFTILITPKIKNRQATNLKQIY
jgi:hypothetical protein